MTQDSRMHHYAAPVREQFVRLLRQEILDGALAPGERVLESALQETYGISRTVVREALRQLESESLITMRPNRGPIVTVLTAEDIESLYVVRGCLEALAGELFAQNASDEDAQSLIAHLAEMENTYLHGDLRTRDHAKNVFYELLLRGSGNPVLASTLRGIHSRIGIFRHYAFVDEQRVAHSMTELRQIVDAAARKRDPKLAGQACHEHIRLAGLLAILEHERRIPVTVVGG
jgi:DNA-binding GntR family transcriptional regulator